MGSIFGFGIIDVDKIRNTVIDMQIEHISNAVSEKTRTFISESVKRRFG